MLKRRALLQAILFYSKFPLLAIFANRLIYSAIGTAADETYNMISVSDPDFTGISGRPPRIDAFCTKRATP